MPVKDCPRRPGRWVPVVTSDQVEFSRLWGSGRNVFAGGGTVLPGGGTLWRSTDGGLTWSEKGRLPCPGWGSALDDLYVASDGLFHSSDEGMSWHEVNLNWHWKAEAVWGSSRADIYCGMGEGPAMLLHTSDGGRSWTPITSPAWQAFLYPGNNPVYRLWGRSPTEVYVLLGNDGRLHRTLDGGQSWSSETGPGNGSIDALHGNAVELFAFAFNTADRGHVLRSTDHGTTWQVEAVPQLRNRDYGVTIWVEPQGTVFLGGDSLVMMRTPDGVWHEEKVETSKPASIGPIWTDGCDVAIALASSSILNQLDTAILRREQ